MSEKVVIDLGEFILKKTSGWDFYRKCDKKRVTYESFARVYVEEDSIHVSKKTEYGFIRAIYSKKAEKRIDFYDECIECGQNFLVRKQGEHGWDFYDKDGKRITRENFLRVSQIDRFVEVQKHAFLSRFSWGLYDNTGKEILAPEWLDIRVITSKYTDIPMYITVRDYQERWGLCSLDGTFILSTEKLKSMMWSTKEAKEYLTAIDNEDNQYLFEYSSEGLKRIN